MLKSCTRGATFNNICAKIRIYPIRCIKKGVSFFANFSDFLQKIQSQPLNIQTIGFNFALLKNETLPIKQQTRVIHPNTCSRDCPMQETRAARNAGDVLVVSVTNRRDIKNPAPCFSHVCEQDSSRRPSTFRTSAHKKFLKNQDRKDFGIPVIPKSYTLTL